MRIYLLIYRCHEHVSQIDDLISVISSGGTMNNTDLVLVTGSDIISHWVHVGKTGHYRQVMLTV